MKSPREFDQPELVAAAYIRANFDPNDRIAVLIRNAKRGETIQRISTTERICSDSFQQWLKQKNEKEACDIYVSMNVLKLGAFTRTKDDILAIRHLYLDLDQGGSGALAAIHKSSRVPIPNYVLNTSPDKFQVIWKVTGFGQEQAEGVLRDLAREFGGDHAATDSTRVLRVPGFLSKKYERDFLVTIQSQKDQSYSVQDFKLDSDLLDSISHRPRSAPQARENTERRPVTQSERDWAYVKRSLERGSDPRELIAELARSRSGDKSDPVYYATLTVTKAMAELKPSNQQNDESTATGRFHTPEPPH